MRQQPACFYQVGIVFTNDKSCSRRSKCNNSVFFVTTTTIMTTKKKLKNSDKRMNEEQTEIKAIVNRMDRFLIPHNYISLISINYLIIHVYILNQFRSYLMYTTLDGPCTLPCVDWYGL